MKIVNTEGENIHIFWTAWGISIKFSGKKWLLIILKVKKKSGFHSLPRKNVVGKTTGEGVTTDSPTFLGLNT